MPYVEIAAAFFFVVILFFLRSTGFPVVWHRRRNATMVTAVRLLPQADPISFKCVHCITLGHTPLLTGRTLNDIGLRNLAGMTVALVVDRTINIDDLPEAEREHVVVGNGNQVIFTMPGRDTPLNQNSTVFIIDDRIVGLPERPPPMAEAADREEEARELLDLFRSIFNGDVHDSARYRRVRMAFERIDLPHWPETESHGYALGPPQLVPVGTKALNLRFNTKCNLVGKILGCAVGRVTWNLAAHTVIRPGDIGVVATLPSEAEMNYDAETNTYTPQGYLSLKTPALLERLTPERCAAFLQDGAKAHV